MQILTASVTNLATISLSIANAEYCILSLDTFLNGPLSLSSGSSDKGNNGVIPISNTFGNDINNIHNLSNNGGKVVGEEDV